MTVQHTDPATAEDRIAEIRARLDAATPGPWKPADTWLRSGGYSATVLTKREDLNETKPVAWLLTWSEDPRDVEKRYPDAEFIAHAPADLAHLLSELEAAGARLAEVRALHKPQRRYVDSTREGETSFDFAEDAAEFYETAVGDVTFFEVCAHCGGLEMDDEVPRDYRDSLWPCKTVRALGLGEEGDDDR